MKLEALFFKHPVDIMNTFSVDEIDTRHLAEYKDLSHSSGTFEQAEDSFTRFTAGIISSWNQGTECDKPASLYDLLECGKSHVYERGT